MPSPTPAAAPPGDDALLPPGAEHPRLVELLRLASPSSGERSDRAVAAAAEARALSLAEGYAGAAARAGVWQCVHLLRCGRHGDVERLSRELDPELRAAESAGERAEMLRALSLAALENGHFDIALDAANQLAALAVVRGGAQAALAAALAMAACLERLGDSAGADRVLSTAIERHGPSASPLPLLLAVNGLTAIGIGAFHRLNGCTGAAEVRETLARAREHGEHARRLLGRIPNPNYEITILGNLGEIYTHLGELGQAGSLLQRAQSRARDQGHVAHRWRVETSMAMWLLATEQPAEALRDAEALLAEMGQEAPPETQLRARHVAYLAARSLGRTHRALEHLEIVERLERRRATLQLQALSRLRLAAEAAF